MVAGSTTDDGELSDVSGLGVAGGDEPSAGVADEPSLALAAFFAVFFLFQEPW